MGTIRSRLLGGLTMAVAAAGLTHGAFAAEGMAFKRIATMPVYLSLAAGTDLATETVAEIISVSKDGKVLVFTDSPGNALIFVDASNPAAPKPLRRVALGGEPTSVTTSAQYALVGVNTSESYGKPSGHLAVIDIASGAVAARCDVMGQPDSVAISPDGKYFAVAIENERDEELNDGVIPQMPAGHLAVFDLDAMGGPKNCTAARMVKMTGLAKVAPTDPEPEFVHINSKNVAVVTLQENNHIALVDLAKGKVIKHFSAGTSSAAAIPTKKARLVDGTGSIADVPREPDAVAWIDDDRFITANEGDYKGGSRGFTIWNTKGEVLFDSGAMMEHLAMAHGHYPAKRAHKKGSEPEGVAVGTFGADKLLFVNSERGNFVAVFKDTGAAPEFLQVLPTGVAPEGLLAIGSRNLFVAANEKDKAKDGVRSNIGIYQLMAGAADYPSVISTKDAATKAPIGWGALSGLVADATNENTVYAVSDSFYDTARIFTMDVSAKPARIVSSVDLKGGAAKKYDLEGISLRQGGGFWVASEGNAKKEMDHLLLAVAADGSVEQEIQLPKEMIAQSERFGLEGVAEFQSGGKTRVAIAVQREWKDDPKGMVKLAIYTPADKSWGFVHYPLNKPVNGGWVGLSEITLIEGERFLVIERDNKGGPDAALKQVTTISLEGVTPAPFGSPLPVVKKQVVADMLPILTSYQGWTLDKVEGLAITAKGRVIAVTDNDGIDDATGETRLFELGDIKALVK